MSYSDLFYSRTDGRTLKESVDSINREGIYGDLNVNATTLEWEHKQRKNTGDLVTNDNAWLTVNAYDFGGLTVEVSGLNSASGYYFYVTKHDKGTDAWITGNVVKTGAASYSFDLEAGYNYRFGYITPSTEAAATALEQVVFEYNPCASRSAVQVLNTISDSRLNSYRQRAPLMSIIDDDGYLEFYSALLPIARAKGVPIASAVEGAYIAKYNGSRTGFMTYSQIQEVYNSGCEILGHANGSLESRTYAEAEADVKKTREVIEHLGIPCRGYVYPASGGGATPAIRALLSKYYEFAVRGAEGKSSDMRYNAQPGIGTLTDKVGNYYILRINCGGYYDDNSVSSKWTSGGTPYAGTSLDYFKAIIDDAVTNNGWIVLMLHSRLMVDGQKQEEYESIDQIGLLEDVIDYAIAQGMSIVNPSEGFDIFGNAWQAGDYIGPWNNDLTKAGHTKPGCACDRLGNADFPSN